MNYIDITQPNQTLKLNLNYNGDLTNNAIRFDVFQDGSDTRVDDFEANLIDNGYYQLIDLSVALDLAGLEDETQYNITGVDTADNDRVVYRGKFQTTSKDLNNLSVNEGQYIKKTTATNYTILD
jgi:hypothetical protein